MCIGERIAELRRNNKMTQRDLGERLNVSDKVISKWETGKSLPDVETMMRLTKVFGISIAELYDSVEKDSGEGCEDYAEERLWQYKKYSIVSYFLILLSPILFLLSFIEWSYNDALFDVFRFILIMATIASFVLSLIFQISQFVRLYSYSKTKFYQAEYKRVMKKYGLTYLAFLAVPFLILSVLIVLSMTA